MVDVMVKLSHCYYSISYAHTYLYKNRKAIFLFSFYFSEIRRFFFIIISLILENKRFYRMYYCCLDSMGACDCIRDFLGVTVEGENVKCILVLSNITSQASDNISCQIILISPTALGNT